MAKLTLKDIDLKDKTVLLRADFNVPQDVNLKITDDTRIRSTVPTLKYILEHGAKKLVLMSHLGRPDGKVVAKYSLKPIAALLWGGTTTSIAARALSIHITATLRARSIRASVP